MKCASLYFLVAPISSVDQAWNTQYPTFHLCLSALRRRQLGLQKRCKRTTPVSARQPGGDTEGVMLVAGAVFPGEAK
jgi:hypothetical protein